MFVTGLDALGQSVPSRLGLGLLAYLAVCLTFRISTKEVVEGKGAALLTCWVMILNVVAQAVQGSYDANAVCFRTRVGELGGILIALLNWTILFSFYVVWADQIRGRVPPALASLSSPLVDKAKAQVMRGLVVIVTGSNSGIGTETARELLRLGATVIMACRSRASAEGVALKIAEDIGGDAVERVSVMDLDLSSFKSVRNFAQSFQARYSRLDVLVHNAGIMSIKRIETVDGLEINKQVNHMSVQLLTLLLLPLLRQSTRPGGARIVLVGSSSHKISKQYGGVIWDDLQVENDYNVVKAYSQSKLCLELFRTELCRRLENADARGVKGCRVTCNSVSPGTVLTNVTRDLPYVFRMLHKVVLCPVNKMPVMGAYSSVYAAAESCAEKFNDQWIEHCRPKDQFHLARDAAAAQRLWALTEEATGLVDPVN